MAAIVNTNKFKLSFTNEHTVYENYVTAQIKENEFNLTYNPSLRKTGSDAYSQIKDFATGSTFHPYASTLGLYNDNNELLAVAKLSKPLKKDFTKEALIRVKLDF